MSQLVVSYSQTFASPPDAKALFAALLGKLPAGVQGYLSADEQPPFGFSFSSRKQALSHLETASAEECLALGATLEEVTIYAQVFEPETSEGSWEGTFDVLSVFPEDDAEAFLAKAGAQHQLFTDALADLGLSVSESGLTNIPQPA